MDSSLYPPNRHSLSDTIVGGIVQPKDHRFDYSSEQYFNAASPSSPSFHRPSSIAVQDEASERKRSTQLQSSAPSKPRLEFAQRSKSRRERCKINQARYRNKQRQHVEHLESGVQQLHSDIDALQARKQKLVRSAPTGEEMWSVAVEYFRLFRHGYTVPPIATNPATSIPERSQLEFLQATMVPDMDHRALDILEQWRHFSLHHKDVNYRLKRLERGLGDSLKATTTTSFTITESTLMNLFPYLGSSEDDNDGEWSQIAKRLLNRRLEVQGSVNFHWDSARGRVMRLETQSDLLSPVLKLLGSLQDVAAVFDGALITPECKLLVRGKEGGNGSPAVDSKCHASRDPC